MAIPEILFVNATYRLNGLRMPLYIFMAEDSLGQTEIIAFCLINSEERTVIEQLSACFKRNNPNFEKKQK